MNPETGTIIRQTFGFGTRLDIIRLEVDTEGGDLYSTFVGIPWEPVGETPIDETVIDWLRAQKGPVPPPEAGRLIRVGE